MFYGGLRFDRQRFDRTAATVQSGMLLLAAVALAMPAIYELIDGRGLPAPRAERIHYDPTVQALSFWVALVLMATYVAGRARHRPPHDAVGLPDAVDVGGEHRAQAVVGAQQRLQALLVERLAEVHVAPAAPGSERGVGRIQHVRGPYAP